MKKYWILVAVVVLLFVFGERWWEYSKKKKNIETPVKNNSEEVIMEKADEVIIYLMDKNMAGLSETIHPDKGLIFSPYANIKADKNKFSAGQIRKIFTDNALYTWGNYDGSGKPIELSIGDYWDKFVYDKDFAGATTISFNKKEKTGNVVDNSGEVFGNAKFVEYHFPGFEAKYEGMDWESLRLYFEEKDKQWYLVGIVHDGWTI